MSAFVALCALLVAIALAFLLTPLVRRRAPVAAEAPGTVRNATVYREQLAELDADLARGSIDQAQWAVSRSAIERRALDEAEEENSPALPATAPPRRAVVSAALVGVVVPVAAVAIYLLLGTPQALSPQAMHGPQPSASSEQIEAMVQKLADRMKTTPEDTEGWIMLGRSYAAMGRFAESAGAFAKGAAQRPNDARLLADYADALGMANGRNLEGEPAALVARALKADPKNIKALTLAGTIAYQKGEFAKAVQLWQAILPQVQDDPEFTKSINGIIADAQDKLGSKPGPKGAAAVAKNDSAAAPAKGPAANTGAALLQGTVSLSPALKAKASPDDTVFIFARAASGPRMPLAIMRSTVKELPVKFSLDDSSAMSPAMKLSAFDQVVVVARISRSGTPTAQKGDLEGMTAVIAPRGTGIKLEINGAIE